LAEVLHKPFENVLESPHVFGEHRKDAIFRGPKSTEIRIQVQVHEKVSFYTKHLVNSIIRRNASVQKYHQLKSRESRGDHGEKGVTTIDYEENEGFDHDWCFILALCPIEILFARAFHFTDSALEIEPRIPDTGKCLSLHG
jgi:hypothetical protein